MKNFLARLSLGLALGSLLSAINYPVSTWAQGTAFTYQGRLNDGGAPAGGNYDLKFTLYDALTGGSIVGTPLTNAPVGVSNGLFTVTLDFGAGVFDGNPRWLEIGVRTTGNGSFFTLNPRQALTPAPYAITAGVVTGPINGGLITAGTVTGSQLATGAAAANLNASGQSGVPSGGVVLSPTNNSALLNAGYVRIGNIQESDLWQQRDNGPPPGTRSGHTAVWTGTEMMVWGGYNGSTYLNDGARYNPTANFWTAMPTNGAPAGRATHTAVWTGTEMIIWGGASSVFLNDGARYNPTANTWTNVNPTDAPAARYEHSVIWTGTEMIIWGGSSGGFFNDGGRYNPATDTWAKITTSGAPAIRTRHTAVWTGSEMIIWGGLGASSSLNDGARYHPAENSWTAMTTSGAASARSFHTAVWTGDDMIIWGGFDDVTYVNTGARYSPKDDAWNEVTAHGAPAARRFHTALWSGTEMIVWGGFNGSYLNDGQRYNPSDDVWNTLAPSNASAVRREHTAVWTGSDMIVWGGFNGSYLNDGGRYLRTANMWTATPASAPSARDLHTAVWTGSEMLVWGGARVIQGGGISYLNDGGRYNPVAHIWTPITTIGAPAPRSQHTAVWTGTEMIVWGGHTSNSTYYADGGRYNPAANTWTPILNSLPNTPGGRYYHTAVWTGSEMIVWGGASSINTDWNDGGRYNPASNSWTPILNSLPNTPSVRRQHTAVWTGTEMIVWGGFRFNGGVSYNDGARYNPAGNSWTPVGAIGAPAARLGHTAVWTGSEMITWGRSSGNTGGRYNPISDGWTPTSTSGGNPSFRNEYTAVWTGSEMIIWGGFDNTDVNLYDGGRYDPVSNSWTPTSLNGAPPARRDHTAVWTGAEMILFGGNSGSGSGVSVGDTWSYTPGRNMFLYQRP